MKDDLPPNNVADEPEAEELDRWFPVRDLARRAVKVLLSRYPERWDEIEAQVESAYRSAEADGRIEDPEKFVAGIVRHKVIDFLRSPTARTVHLGNLPEALQPASFDNELEATAFRIDLATALRALNDENPSAARALLMHLDGCLGKEIASTMDTSPATVSRLLKQARDFLSSLLESQ